jgi:hypothetical protein
MSLRPPDRSARGTLRGMRRLAHALTATAVVALIACGSSAPAESVVCLGVPIGCSCELEAAPQSDQVSLCNASAFPDSMCCADPRWPSSGTCNCLTSAIFCGVVAGYEPASDGGAGVDACVCSNDPYSTQVIGPTCYANGTTSAADGLGTCCMFSADAPGSLGVAACVCAAGLHTCADGGSVVENCSAGSFPSPPAACDQGTTQVDRCL